MQPEIKKLLTKTSQALHDGQVIAYPTEGVFGLGCDPFNEQAVNKLLALKGRSISKGLILIAANWQQVEFLTAPIPISQLMQVMQTWPGAITWVFPASPQAPKWIIGDHNSIALRITAHPIAKEISLAFKGPIVSTSANLQGLPPAHDADTVSEQFGDKLAIVFPGKVGDLTQPTPIFDALTQSRVR